MQIRLFRSVSVALVALALACSSKSDDAAAVPVVVGPDGGDPPATTLPDGAPLPDGNVVPTVTPSLTGTLKTNDGRAVAGVEVRVLDAAGAGRFAITDTQGAFSFSQVANPYDLHVATGENYLGSSATKLDLRTASTSAGGGSSHGGFPSSAGVAVTLPNCIGSYCLGRWVIDLGGAAIAGGSNGSSLNYPPATPPATFNTSYISWRGPAVVTGTLRMLINDTELAHYFYGEVPVTIDGTTSTPTITLGAALAPVAITTAPTTVTVDRTQLDAADVVQVSGSFVLPGSTTALSFAQQTLPGVAPAIVAVPQLAGANMTMVAFSSAGGKGSTSSSFSGPIATSAISLALAPAPQFTAPITGSSIDESAIFSWKGSAQNALYELNVYQTTTGRSRRIFTTGTSVPLLKLLALDGAPGLGGIRLDVTSASPVVGGIDAYVTQWSDLAKAPTRGAAESVQVTRVGPDAGADGGGD